MSFATSADVMDVVEKIIKELWPKALGLDAPGEFRKIPYWWAIKNYGSDKPDLRFGKSRVRLC
jgi:aspartyl-tRNA synthetase